MKIYYFANIRFPTEKAHGYQIAKTCEAFRKLGVEVELIVPSRRNPKLGGQAPQKYYDLQKDFTLTRLFSFDPHWLVGLPGAIYPKLQSLFFASRLALHLFWRKKDDSGIFYTRDEFLLPFLQRFSRNVVWEAHALPGFRKLYAKYFQRCRAVIVLTDFLKVKLQALGLSQEKILVAPDAVDLEIFDVEMSKEEARARLNLPLGAKILGYTGTFQTKNMDKGVALILEALKILESAEPEAIFVAVGGSDKELKYYENLASRQNVSDKVKLKGRVKRQELAVYQKACDVLLMPFPRNEHFASFMSPLKMFEYMASRRPIVATSLPSIREVLNDGNALLVEPENPRSLAEGIKQVLANPNLAKSLAEKAYENVQNHTWQKRAGKILSFISR